MMVRFVVRERIVKVVLFSAMFIVHPVHSCQGGKRYAGVKPCYLEE